MHPTLESCWSNRWSIVTLLNNKPISINYLYQVFGFLLHRQSYIA